MTQTQMSVINELDKKYNEYKSALSDLEVAVGEANLAIAKVKARTEAMNSYLLLDALYRISWKM